MHLHFHEIFLQVLYHVITWKINVLIGVAALIYIEIGILLQKEFYPIVAMFERGFVNYRKDAACGVQKTKASYWESLGENFKSRSTSSVKSYFNSVY